MNHQVIKRFPINENGRDFIIGDIHGSFDLVIEAINKVNFDPTKDRLFSVGDLVDRGEQSRKCSSFLNKQYIHAVRGNHEDMFLELYQNGPPDEAILQYACRQNGMSWWLEIDEDKRLEIINAFKKLPLAIEIETNRGKVGLIHAEVPEGMNWATFIENLEIGDNKTVQSCLWGRTRIYRGNDDGVEGIDRLFVGHTPQWEGVHRLGNIYFVDTGAVFGKLKIEEKGHFTMANIVVATKVLIAPRIEDLLVEIKEGKEQLNISFGNYVKTKII